MDDDAVIKDPELEEETLEEEGPDEDELEEADEFGAADEEEM